MWALKPGKTWLGRKEDAGGAVEIADKKKEEGVIRMTLRKAGRGGIESLVRNVILGKRGHFLLRLLQTGYGVLESRNCALFVLNTEKIT